MHNKKSISDWKAPVVPLPQLPDGGGGRGGGGGINSNFQRGLFLDFFGQYLEYNLHCIGCFIWHSVESFALISHVYVECTNFQRGLYLKFRNHMLTRNSMMWVVFSRYSVELFD